MDPNSGKSHLGLVFCFYWIKRRGLFELYINRGDVSQCLRNRKKERKMTFFFWLHFFDWLMRVDGVYGLRRDSLVRLKTQDEISAVWWCCRRRWLAAPYADVLLFLLLVLLLLLSNIMRSSGGKKAVNRRNKNNPDPHSHHAMIYTDAIIFFFQNGFISFLPTHTTRDCCSSSHDPPLLHYNIYIHTHTHTPVYKTTGEEWPRKASTSHGFIQDMTWSVHELFGGFFFSFFVWDSSSSLLWFSHAGLGVRVCGLWVLWDTNAMIISSYNHRVRI